jgi:hypothetical protein
MRVITAPPDQVDQAAPGRQGESLEDLQAVAAGLEADQVDQAGAPGQLPDAAQGPTNAQLLASALELGRDAFCAFTDLDSPRAIMTAARLDVICDAWAKVLDKRGISLSSYVSDWGAEIAAVVVTVPMVLELRRAVGAEVAARQPAEAKPAAPGVTDGG